MTFASSKISKICFALMFAVVGGAVVPPPALAQNNLPYRAGSGVGISLGARQAIINEKIQGSRPSELLRGPSGLLFGIENRNDQALVRSPEGGAFLPGMRPNSGWATGLGTGLGWGGISSGGGGYYLGSSSSSMSTWISMLPATPGRPFYGPGAVFGNSSTPINAWIGQLARI